MGFTVSSLTNYVEEIKGQLIPATVLSARTIKEGGISIQVGVKSAETINLLDVDGEFQADGGCAYNSSGATTFTQRTITVSKVKIQQTLCPEDLEAKYLQYAVQPGSTHDKLPFEAEIVAQIQKKIARNLEMAFWQSDTTDNAFNTNLKQFEGMISIIDGASPVTGNTSSATSITSSNILTLIDNMYKVVPARLLGQEDLTLFMGMDNFRLLLIAMKDANNFHFESKQTNFTTTLPWLPSLKIMAVNGLNADNDSNLGTTYKNRMFLCSAKNLFFGTDLANEYEKFDIWYSKDDQNIKTDIKFKAGCQVAYGTEIVQYTNA